MKTILILLFAVIGCSSDNPKEQSWPWNALLLENDKSINVYESSILKSVKYQLKNDTEKEEFYLIEILQKKDSAFEIKSASAFHENEISTGWVNFNELGIYLRPTNVEGSILLYTAPDIDSQTIPINGNRTELVKIIDLDDSWLKVELRNNTNQEMVIGWLNKKNQCSNPYSTCN